MSIFAQGAFQQTANETPDQIKRKRALIQAMMPQYGKARYVGEGLGQLFQGIGSGMQERKLDKAEATGTQGANDIFSRILGGAGRSGGTESAGMVNSPFAPQMPSAQPVDPNSPGAIGDDAMAAIGRPTQAPEGQEAAFNFAAKNIGLNENDQAAALTDFMKTGGVNLDPQTTAWCAAYVNASLGQAGMKGTGSNMARSFLDWGQGVDQPTRGDIGVLPRGDPNGPFGHVGFVDGVNEDGSIRLLGGNQGDAVSVQNYAADQFLGFRRAGEGAPQPAQDMSSLYEAMANPFMSQEQRAVLTQMIQQGEQQADPGYQMGLRKQQLELEELENPQADPMDEVALAQARHNLAQDQAGAGAELPAGFAALDMQARASGYEPGTPEYQDWMRNGGGAPASFTALDLQAKASGYQPGTEEYKRFMASRGAYERANDGAVGKAAGEANAAADSLGSKMEGLEAVVAELDILADEATYTTAGQLLDSARTQFGMQPRDSAIARAEYIAKVDNQVLPLLRDTFGAAFTVKEGETLRATLGDPDKSPEAKKAVLRAFIEQKKRDLKALQQQAVNGAPAPITTPGGNTIRFDADGNMIQ